MRVASSDGGVVERVLHAASEKLGVALDAHSLALLVRYAEHLLAWNRRINLSGAADAQTLAAEHLADALALIPHLPAQGVCVDVGTGAGLPGIVLAIARPDLQFTLLEPSGKRRMFLRGTVRELGLRNVTVLGERLASHLERHRAGYDFAVARAVLPLREWLRAGSQLVRSGGSLVGLVGSSPPDELPAGGRCIRYEAAAGPRTLVILTRA
jgi:16S rRNA (guanine527-N7)-methyltransferase